MGCAWLAERPADGWTGGHKGTIFSRRQMLIHRGSDMHVNLAAVHFGMRLALCGRSLACSLQIMSWISLHSCTPSYKFTMRCWAICWYSFTGQWKQKQLQWQHEGITKHDCLLEKNTFRPVWSSFQLSCNCVTCNVKNNVKNSVPTITVQYSKE